VPPNDGTAAVTVTLPAALPERTVVATPVEFVVADASEREARLLLFTLKVTIAPATRFPLPSLTVAFMLAVSPAVIVAGTATTFTLPLAAPNVIVTVMLADAPPAAALTVTTVFENVVAVTVTCAKPLVVVAVALDKIAFT